MFGTAGGGKLRLKTAATIGSSGSAQTPAKRNANSPAAGLTVFNDGSTLTAGTTLTQRLAVGVAQTGGHGGWCALEPAAGLTLLPNGGTNGNAELYSIFNGSAVPVDITVEFAEGC